MKKICNQYRSNNYLNKLIRSKTKRPCESLDWLGTLSRFFLFICSSWASADLMHPKILLFLLNKILIIWWGFLRLTLLKGLSHAIFESFLILITIIHLLVITQPMSKGVSDIVIILRTFQSSLSGELAIFSHFLRRKGTLEVIPLLYTLLLHKWTVGRPLVLLGFVGTISHVILLIFFGHTLITHRGKQRSSCAFV